MGLEKKVLKKIKNKVAVGVFLGISLLNSNCDYKTEEEKCCGCLIENRCTEVSQERCLDIFYVFQGKDSIKIEDKCVGENSCYLPCAKRGAYFESGEMVVDYWKKKDLE